MMQLNRTSRYMKSCLHMISVQTIRAVSKCGFCLSLGQAFRYLCTWVFISRLCVISESSQNAGFSLDYVGLWVGCCKCRPDPQNAGHLACLLLAACAAHAQQSRCGMTIRATPTQLLREKRTIWEREATQGQFLGCNSPLIAHTKLKTSMNVTGQQSSRLVYLIFTKIAYFRVMLVDEKEERR